MEKIIIPTELKNDNSIKLIHLTDTPSQIHKEIQRLIIAVKPKYVVHTGDLCDDIKLERSPRKIDLYDRKIAHFAKLMAKCPGTQFYFVIGNHDNYSTVKNYFPNAQIFDKPGYIENEFGRFSVGHEYKDISTFKSDFYLFGHDMSQNSKHSDDRWILNGLEYIYVLKGNPIELITIEYPYSTDYLRQKKSWVGI